MGAEDWLVVIGADRTVVLSEPATSAAQVSKQLGRKAAELSASRKEASFAAFNPRSPFN